MAKLAPDFSVTYDRRNPLQLRGTGLSNVRTVTLTGTIHGGRTQVSWTDTAKEPGSSDILLLVHGTPNNPNGSSGKDKFDTDSGDVTVTLDNSVSQTYPCDYSV